MRLVISEAGPARGRDVPAVPDFVEAINQVRNSDSMLGEILVMSNRMIEA